MIRVTVGKSRKLCQDYNSYGFNVTVEAEVTATIDDPEKVIAQINDLFNVVEESLNDQVERAGIIQVSSSPKSETSSPARNPFSPHRRFNNGHGHGEESATDKQVQYLINLGKQSGQPKSELEKRIAELLKLPAPKSLYELSKSEAASAIDKLLHSN